MKAAPGRPQVEEVPLASLVPYARNARTHSDAQVDQVAAERAPVAEAA